MEITKTSIISGRINSREIDVTQEEIDRWRGGELIQNVMPHLDDDDREFLMTGITPFEWEENFSGFDEDEDEY